MVATSDSGPGQPEGLRRGAGFPQDHLWWAAVGFLELDDALRRDETPIDSVSHPRRVAARERAIGPFANDGRALGDHDCAVEGPRSQIVMLTGLSSLELALLTAAIIFGATGVGIWIGRAVSQSRSGLREPLGITQGALVGFVALLLAFGLTMAVGRYEARRGGVVLEANAIGTTYLRAQTLREPMRTESPSRNDPASGVSWPTMIRNSVVLPAPFGPMTPTMPLRGSVKARSSKRRRSP